MEDSIVVYQVFDQPIMANIIFTKLQDAGFECFLSGENITNLGFLFDSPLSGVQLHVFENDIPAIDEFLAQTSS